MVGGLDSVGTVADVASDLDGVVSSDGAGKRSLWVSFAKHHTAHLDDVQAFPNHGADWARVHVLDQTGEEWLGGQISVVLLEVFLAWHAELHGDELESSLLESLEDLSDKSSLDTVGLDGKSFFTPNSAAANSRSSSAVVAVDTGTDSVRPVGVVRAKVISRGDDMDGLG